MNLRSVTLPSSITSIGKRAFESCSNLTTIISSLSPSILIDIDIFDTAPINELNFETPVFSLLTPKFKINTIKFNFTKANTDKKLNEIQSLPSLESFSQLKNITIGNINDFTIPKSFVKGDNVDIFIANDISSIDPDAFKNCNIRKFEYYGRAKLDGDFIKNAKSCQEVVTSTKYSGDQLGGMNITSKVEIKYEDQVEATDQPEQPSNQSEQSTKNEFEEDNNKNGRNDNKKKTTGIIVGVVAAVLVVVAVGVIVFIMYKKKSENKSEDDGNYLEENP